MAALAAVALGGAIGAVARYQLSLWIHARWPTAFPTGTLVVNMLGCVLLGILAGTLDTRMACSPQVRLFLGVGLLGAFTTFSTFELETLLAFERGHAGVALTYVAVSVLVGLAAVWMGSVSAAWREHLLPLPHSACGCVTAKLAAAVRT